MGYKPPLGIRSITAYRKRPNLRLAHPSKPKLGITLGLQHIPLLILYAIAMYHCYETAGNPHKAVLAEFEDKVQAAKAETWDKWDDQGNLIEEDLDGDGIPELKSTVQAERERLEAEKKKALEEDPFAMFRGKDGMFPELFAGEDVVEDPNRPTLPPEFLPDFWPTFFLICVLIAHALLELSQHWSVDIRCTINFVHLGDNTALVPGNYAKIVPSDERGEVELVPVVASVSQEEPCLFFDFQKLRYKIVEGDDLVEPVLADITAPVSDYLSAGGYVDTHSIEASRENFGFNKCDIPMPDFLDLYMNQVLRPMCVFQLFTNALWLLDEAWNFAVFGLFSILMMEGMTVFSRLKHIKTIRGMGNTNRKIFVFRHHSWSKISTEELLPGDLISLVPNKDEVIPCDCLVLLGGAIVNESTLTGESIPQMKEAISAADDHELDVVSNDKIHVLFGGTSLIKSEGAKGDPNSESKTVSPDGGLVCYVLQTGFSSSQGKLVRMIQFSSNTNNANAGDPENQRESLMLIGMLLLFAIAASSYVLYMSLTYPLEGLERTRYQLLIRCVIIVTSVVPTDLPMQLAIAVNASLMQLMRQGVFCTEPYRVPMSGRIDCVFFDKTGTVTTDQLEAIGMVPFKPGQRLSGKLTPLNKSPLDACRVLAGCHSLLELDETLQGDPIETASIAAINWDYSQNDSSGRPLIAPPKLLKKKKEEVETTASKKREEERLAKVKEAEDQWKRDRPWGDAAQQVKILHRYHFQSALQRMSVIASCKSGNSKPTTQILVKGSPEMIGSLLATIPDGYVEAYTELVKQGMRVIALACKDVTSEVVDLNPRELSKKQRAWAESDLTFAGFVAFQCLMRKDSKKIINDLQASSHLVSMITGDNMLTAVHAAVEGGFALAANKMLILQGKDGKEDTVAGMSWVNAESGATFGVFDLEDVRSLGNTYALCVSGKALRTLVSEYSLETVAPAFLAIRVFSRMSPHDKELVLTALNARGHITLMCGDGANDVGALKAAHIGVALLGGFGSLNTGKNAKEDDEKKQLEKKLDEFDKTDDELAEMSLFQRIAFENEKTRFRAEKVAEMQKKNKSKTSERTQESQEVMKQKITAETQRLEAQGQSFAAIQAVRNVMSQQQKANRDKLEKAGGSFAASAAAMATIQDGEEVMDAGELPLLKLGDASIAAPFTSKRPSIISVYDIIRQGRCTLVSRVQNNQITCLTCIISSYSLSVLYLEGVKFSDYQLTLSGMLLMMCHLSLSYSTPLEKISSARPLGSMFHPALFVSLVGQFVLHLICMVVSVGVAKTYLPPDYKQEIKGKFTPSLVNTVVFLVQTMQQVSVLMVNYKGRPFQPGLTESKALLNALGICGIGLMVCAYELFPAFNTGVGMVKLPDPQLRTTILGVLSLDILGTLIWDRFCVWLWAPELSRAASVHFNSYTTYLTVRKLSMTILAIFLLVKDGSLISLIIIGYLYRQGYF